MRKNIINAKDICLPIVAAKPGSNTSSVNLKSKLTGRKRTD